MRYFFNKKHEKKKKSILYFALILVILFSTLTFTACNSFIINKKAAPSILANVNDITTINLEKKDISVIVSGIATFQASKTTGLFYKDISGPLKKILVNLGDKVDINQSLIEIDVPDFIKKIADTEQNMLRWPVKQSQISENIDSAAREIKRCELDINGINNRIMNLNNDRIDSATRQIKQIELELEKVRKIYSVEANYLNKQAVDKVQLSYDQAKDNYESAIKEKENEKYINEQALNMAKIGYEQALSSYKSAKLAKELADMDYKIEQRDLITLKEKVASLVLKSPIKGIIVALEKLSDGEVISINRILVKIADPKNFVMQVTSGDALVFQNVKNAVLILNNDKYEVEVYTPQPGDQLEQLGQDAKTKNKFYISFTNGKLPNISLKDSYEVKLEINKRNSLTLPRSVLIEDGGKSKVDVLKGEKIESVEIMKGLENDNIIEIISGISSNDKIILK